MIVSLVVEDVVAGYSAGEQILKGVSLKAEKSKITCLIGPNGGGKTTLLRTIYGFLKPSSGSVDFEGQNILGTKPHDMLREGIGYLSQEKDIFPYLSVEDNLRLSCWTLGGKQISDAMERVYARYPRLKERRKVNASQVSGGERGMLVLGMLQVTNPKILLLDEPTAGLAPIIVKQLTRHLADLAHDGTTVLLVDQNIEETVAISDYVYVLEFGNNGPSGPKTNFLGKEKNLIRSWLEV